MKQATAGGLRWRNSISPRSYTVRHIGASLILLRCFRNVKAQHFKAHCCLAEGSVAHFERPRFRCLRKDERQVKNG